MFTFVLLLCVDLLPANFKLLKVALKNEPFKALILPENVSMELQLTTCTKNGSQVDEDRSKCCSRIFGNNRHKKIITKENNECRGENK